MKFLSLCSGIEAASVAWEPLGWKAVGFSEIEKFPSAVLMHHYPDTPNHGDMTKWKEWNYEPESIDLICGGTPCQSFSVAGLQKGLDDDRGNLCLEFVRAVKYLRPRWMVWENVPGVLSSNEGRDFGAFLGGLAESGYGFAYRIFDAQYIRVDGFKRAVPQRRRRVFVVGYLGDWRPPAAVLLERESLQGHPAPRRKAGQGAAGDVGKSLKTCSGGIDREDGYTLIPDVYGCLSDGAHNGGGLNGQDAHSGRIIPVAETAGVITAGIHKGPRGTEAVDSDHLVTCAPVAPSMTAGGAPFERTGNERVECDAIIAESKELCLMDQGGSVMNVEEGITGTLRRETKGHEPIVAFAQNTRDEVRLVGGDGSISGALAAEPGMKQTTYAQIGMSVRRLTPIECERLQGFPDNYTRIPWRGKAPADCPDGPRYKALGNSWAVNCARWVGTRIQMVENL